MAIRYCVPIILLAACANPPKDGYYVPPHGLPDGEIVNVAGARYDPSIMLLDEFAYVWSVDDKMVDGTRDQWKTPLALTAGVQHKLGLEYSVGGVQATRDVTFTGFPGQRVAVKYDIEQKNGSLYLWLADAETGTPLTDKPLIAMSNTGGAAVFMPIFIRK